MIPMTEAAQIARMRRRRIRWELRKLGVLAVRNAVGKKDHCNICGNAVKNIGHFRSHPEVWYKALSKINRDLLLSSEVATVEEIEVIAR